MHYALSPLLVLCQFSSHSKHVKIFFVKKKKKMRAYNQYNRLHSKCFFS